MARVFITGSSDGLGLAAGKLLAEQGHNVVLHARNAQRADETRRKLSAAAAVLTGDFASLAEVRSLAEQANAMGTFDAVVHNAAIGYREKKRSLTVDGFEHVFAINTLAPYLLTALMHRPKRLVYLSSELHRRGHSTLDDLQWERRAWNGTAAYSDTKLHDTLLAFAVARRWPGVLSNSVEPGWVATKMGGPNASGDLSLGHVTQAWLAVSDDPAAQVTGKHWFHQKERKPLAAANDAALQDLLLGQCAALSGVEVD